MAQDSSPRPFTQHVLLSEIGHQARIAIRAAERLAAIERGLGPVDIWSSIQLILVAAGSISKILWPVRDESAARGEILRGLLTIDASSPLYDRRFRNHFEHYDERVEDWLESVPTSSCRDWMLGPPNSIARQFPGNVHRGYDHTTQTLTFRGETMDPGAVLAALQEISRKCPTPIDM
jgi:hypothetical protein